jgi:hypothetical protein
VGARGRRRKWVRARILDPEYRSQEHYPGEIEMGFSFSNWAVSSRGSRLDGERLLECPAVSLSSGQGRSDSHETP